MPNDTRSVHVVGMYKSGTSWLLHCLAAHPEIIAWREFDPISASYQRVPRQVPVLRAASAVRHLLGGRTDLAYGPIDHVPRSLEGTFHAFFMGQGWVPLYGSALQHEAARLPSQDIPRLVDALFRMMKSEPVPDDTDLRRPGDYSNTLGVINFSRNNLIELMQTIRACKQSTEAPRAFYEFVERLCAPGSVVAFKAADQIMSLPQLRHAAPRSHTIAIVRDGRDAAVSARNYEQLMRQEEAPWRVGKSHTIAKAMISWATRASKAISYRHDDRFMMLRYEDLHSNFNQVFGEICQFVGVSNDAKLIAAVKEETDFHRVSGGRKKGEAAESRFRKGVVGDWQQALNENEQRVAWWLARKQLRALGYSRDGA